MLLNPYFGEFGGTYVPEILVPALEQFEAEFVAAQNDPAFHAAFKRLLREYAGRPRPLTRLSQHTAGSALSWHRSRPAKNRRQASKATRQGKR